MTTYDRVSVTVFYNEAENQSQLYNKRHSDNILNASSCFCSAVRSSVSAVSNRPWNALQTLLSPCCFDLMPIRKRKE